MSQSGLSAELPMTSTLVESFECDDVYKGGIASYRVASPDAIDGTWPAAKLFVQVERHHGRGPRGWAASLYFELHDARRTWWSEDKIFATRDAAACEAADMALAGRRLLEAHLRGEAVETPRHMRQMAADACAGADAGYLEALQRAEEARAAFAAFDEDAPERWAAGARCDALVHAAEQVRQRLCAEFCAEHGWREFA